VSSPHIVVPLLLLISFGAGVLIPRMWLLVLALYFIVEGGPSIAREGVYLFLLAAPSFFRVVLLCGQRCGVSGLHAKWLSYCVGGAGLVGGGVSVMVLLMTTSWAIIEGVVTPSSDRLARPIVRELRSASMSFPVVSSASHVSAPLLLSQLSHTFSISENPRRRKAPLLFREVPGFVWQAEPLHIPLAQALETSPSGSVIRSLADAYSALEVNAFPRAVAAFQEVITRARGLSEVESNLTAQHVRSLLATSLMDGWKRNRSDISLLSCAHDLLSRETHVRKKMVPPSRGTRLNLAALKILLFVYRGDSAERLREGLHHLKILSNLEKQGRLSKDHARMMRSVKKAIISLLAFRD
jgi:hypothetical protein